MVRLFALRNLVVEENQAKTTIVGGVSLVNSYREISKRYSYKASTKLYSRSKALA